MVAPVNDSFDFFGDAFGGFKNIVKQTTEQVGSNIGSFLQQQTQQALVKVGIAQSGNLTEAELKEGNFGQAQGEILQPSQKPVASTARALGTGDSASMLLDGKNLLVFGGLGIVALLLIMRRK